MRKVTKRAVTASAPKHIWLHSAHPEAPTENNVYHFDLEWLEFPESETRDVEYVRADLVRAALPVNFTEDRAWRRLAKVLGIKPKP
jgi:hypothetical protein